MNKIFIAMVAIAAMASMMSMNAFAETNSASGSYVISGVPFDKIDQSYKNLKIDSTKTTYIIYMDSNLSVRQTTGTSWVDGSQFNGLVVEGTCLNMESIGDSVQQNESCFNQFSPVMSDFDEIQSGNFLILQSK